MSDDPESLNYLTECPHCGSQYTESTRLPRYLPCCSETLCHQCLTAGQNNGTLTCPLCNKQHKSIKSVASVPVDKLVLKLLDFAESIGNGPLCDYCRAKNEAVATCRQCNALLCQACLSTHVFGALPTSHTVTTFEDLKLRHIARRSHASRSLSLNSVSLLEHLKQKGEKMRTRIEELEAAYRNIAVSRKRATEDIAETFDGLVKMLLSRKETLLKQVTARADDDARMVTSAKVAHQNLYGKIKKQANNIARGRKGAPTDTLLLVQENPEDIDFVRKGVAFVNCNVQHIHAILQTTGLVRSVTYSRTSRPQTVPANVTYNAISMEPSYLPTVSDEDVGFLSHRTASSEQTCSLGDQVVVLRSGSATKTLFCPNLEWDTTTASRTLATSRSVVSNIKPEVPLPATGCRLGAERHVMTSKPLLMRNGQQAMFHIKVKYRHKMAIQENKMMFEMTLTNSPVETSWNKPNGLSLTLASCPQHKQQLCVHLVHDNQLLQDVPVSDNEVDVAGALHFGVLLNSAKNEIHVLDIDEVDVIGSVADVNFEKALWVMVMTSYPSWSAMSAAMISGTGVRMTKKLNHLLSSLQ